MSNTALPRGFVTRGFVTRGFVARVFVALAVPLVLPLASCQSTSSGKTTSAPVAAEPTPAQTETADAANTQQDSVGATQPEPALPQVATAKSEPAVTEPAVVEPAIAGTANAEAELIFLDFAGFDEDLSREMNADRATIAVDVPAAFSLNDVPDRLDRWFYRVKETGGAVQARQKPSEGERQTRGIVGVLLDIAVSAIEAQEAEEMLRPAEEYNVVLEYDKETGKADRVLFYRR